MYLSASYQISFRPLVYYGKHAWRVDNGRADTIHEYTWMTARLTLPPGPVRGRDELRAWGRQIVDNTQRLKELKGEIG